MTGRNLADQFAAATDALLAGNASIVGLGLEDELIVARELVAHAQEAAIDPEFAASLRAELMALTGASGEVLIAPLETPLGQLFVAYRGHKVVSARISADIDAFGRSIALRLHARPRAEAAPPAWLRTGVLAHLEGRDRFADVDLTWLPAFQRRVLEKTAEIPRGEVRPYGWVAREIGAPGAVRAVGTALGHNPIPFIIPCHRVVRSDGSLGEYSGGGPEVKVRVLTFEGAPLNLMMESARRGARVRASRATGVFCYPTCHAARDIANENLVEFASPASAVIGGFRPCTLCRPQ
jgi:O-6-methylguanine DNA methyltransferase